MTIAEEGMVAHYARLENMANILHDKRIKFGGVKNTNDPRESYLIKTNDPSESHASWIVQEGIGKLENPEQKK